MIVCPHQLAIAIKEVNEHGVIFRESRRVCRHHEPVAHVDRHPDRGVGPREGDTRSGDRRFGLLRASAARQKDGGEYRRRTRE